MKVYAVGCLQIDTNPEAKQTIKQQRLWSLYARFEDAEKCILENHGDIFEYSFTHALIEEVLVIDPNLPYKEGESAEYPPKEWWYQADYSVITEDHRDPLVTKVDKPKCLDRVCCFWVN